MDIIIKNKPLALILLLGFLLRICFVFYLHATILTPDSFNYFSQATEILKGRYIDYFPNGYPFLIALIKAFFTTSKAMVILLWINVILSTVSIYFIYAISKKVFQTEAAALLAALIIACHVSQLNYVPSIMTEVPATFFLTGAYYFYYIKKNWIAGLLTGLLVVMRSEMLLIGLLLVAFDTIHKRKINLRLVLGALLPIVIVGYYCYLKTGNFSLEGNSKYNIIVATTASGSTIDFDYPYHHPEIATKQMAVKRYMDFVKKEPAKFIKSRLANLWELWGCNTSPLATGPSIASRIFILAGNLFLLVFGITAWWKNRKNYKAFILIIPFIVITAIHTAFFGLYHRFVYPVEPFMIVLSAWMIYQLFGNAIEKRFKFLPANKSTS